MVVPPAAPVPRLPELTVTTGGADTEVVLRRAGSDNRIAPPSWLDDSDETLVAGQEPPPEQPLPLFGRLWQRGILSAALATHVAEGDFDFDRIFDIVSERRMLEELPRLPVPTLRRGVQLLLDRAPGMDPFLLDQDALVRALDDILSDDRLEVLYFAGCPSRGAGPGTRSNWQKWKPPLPGVPVLIVSNFGIGGPPLDEERASTGEWLEFIRRARAAGPRLVGLVPYHALRWPPAIARALTLLHWSERTTVGEVRRAQRDTRRKYQ
jgi:hypothetical protein